MECDAGLISTTAQSALLAYYSVGLFIAMLEGIFVCTFGMYLHKYYLPKYYKKQFKNFPGLKLMVFRFLLAFLAWPLRVYAVMCKIKTGWAQARDDWAKFFRENRIKNNG